MYEKQQEKHFKQCMKNIEYQFFFQPNFPEVFEVLFIE
jgi:hypothetical protein